MKSNSKELKTKSVAIRIQEKVYDFIAKKSAEQGLTKSDFLISQFDMNSELMTFITAQSGLMELEVKKLKKELQDSREDWKLHWVSATDEEIKMALKTAKKTPKDVVYKPIITEAKKRGLL
jgi:hypothetical protein